MRSSFCRPPTASSNAIGGTTPRISWRPIPSLVFPKASLRPRRIRIWPRWCARATNTASASLLDVVMAFARHEVYQTLNLDDFYIPNPGADLSDPDSHTSRGTGQDNLRNG